MTRNERLTTVFAAAIVFAAACDRMLSYYECPDGRIALPWELAGNEVDDNCNGVVDAEELGAPSTRAHCGEPHRACVLSEGAADVACIGGACVGLSVGPPSPGEETSCFDGMDDDGDGVIDNGPGCEVLIANAARPDCRGHDPLDPECPPTSFEMGANGGDESPRQTVLMTYDYLVDRYEVSQAAFHRYICEKRAGETNLDACLTSTAIDDRMIPGRRWTFSADPKTPAGDLSWCDAALYCAWAGKRMLSEAEWERMARGTVPNLDRPFPWNRIPVPSNFECAEAGKLDCRYDPAVRDCCSGGDAPKPVDRIGGMARIGDTEDIQNVAGNVWEWVYDWFNGSYATFPEGLQINRVQHEISFRGDSHHVLRGGGYSWVLGSAVTSNRVAVRRGWRSPSFGARCARTFGDAPPDLHFDLPGDPGQCEPVVFAARPAPDDVLLAVSLEIPQLRPIGIECYPTRQTTSCSVLLGLALTMAADGSATAELGRIVGGGQEPDGYSWNDSPSAMLVGSCQGGSCRFEPRGAAEIELEFGVGSFVVSVDAIDLVDAGELSECEQSENASAPIEPRAGDRRATVYVQLPEEEAAGVRIFGESAVDVVCNNAACDARELQKPVNDRECVGCSRDVPCMSCSSLPFTLEARFRPAREVYAAGKCLLGR